jgi:hypothetical protein
MIRFSYIAIILLILSPANLSGQISKNGVPPGFSKSAETTGIPFETFILHHIDALQQEDAIIDSISEIPWRFGENLPADLGLMNAGIWETLPSGTRIWQLGIHSPGAYSINLTFNRYRLPPGAELYVYNADRTFVIGAFTDANNQQDRYFATTPIPGDSIIIEYVEPAEPAFAGELHLETVTHAYRSLYDFTRKFGRSGSCNLNVACDEAKGLENQIDAVVMMLVGSNSLCTGTLINNTNFDGRPYVLSANHCYRSPSTLVFWFNWQGETCENPTQPPPYDAMSGAVSRVRQSVSDAWLIELNQDVPIGYNPFYAGWDRSLDSAITETVVSIHHPRGDIKKISYALHGAVASSYVGGAGSGTTHWRVVWSGGTTTEPTSSGSPLFNSEGLIIGQLHGGYAACGNTLPDWYGRFGVSWDMGSEPQTQLKHWLDPHNTNALSINGYRPTENIVEPPSGFYPQTLSADSILLNWSLNDKSNPVMLAYHTSETFGVPSGGYTVGDTLDGGGIILYMGAEQQLVFHPALSDTLYYFRAWSYNHLLSYSSAVDTSALSGKLVIHDFPYVEAFHETLIPYGWRQTTDNQNRWQIGRGNGMGIPSAPYSGNHNLYYFPSAEEPGLASPILASPEMNLSGYDEAIVSFYYSAIPDDSNQDEIAVYYRTDPASEWVLLHQPTGPASQWTRAEVDLPTLSASAQLGFQATWQGGRGICLDAIRVHAIDHESHPPPENLQVTLVNGHSLQLIWEAPDLAQSAQPPAAYRIYRNHQAVDLVNYEEKELYVDTGLSVGNYNYYVTAVYDDPPGESAVSNRSGAAILPSGIIRFLLVEINGEGITSPSATTPLVFNNGALTLLTATPASDHVFQGWYVQNEQVSTNPLLAVLMDRDQAFEAVFSRKEHLVSTVSVPSETGIQEGGGLYKHGETTRISTTVPLGSRFKHWSRNEKIISTSTTFHMPVVEPAELIAQFEQLYQVNLLAQPSVAGIVRGEGIYSHLSTVAIEAIPNPGWVFDYWEEDGEILSASEEYVFLIENDREITAVFSQKRYEVMLQVDPPDAGTATGAGAYEPDVQVTVTAEPNPDWRFVGWMENDQVISVEASYTFIINEDRQLTARMEPAFFLLTITSEGKGKTVPETGSYPVEKGNQVMLSAQPERGWRFKHWRVNGVFFEKDTIDVIMENAIHATAVFYFPDITNTTIFPEQEILVFPNPGSGLFTVNLGAMSGHVKVDVFAVSGQSVFCIDHVAGPGESSLLLFDLSGRHAGVYLLRVTGREKIFYQKIIKH